MKRRGFALPMALVIVIVGTVLSALILDMGYSFLFSMQDQESVYMDHIIVSDYVEAAKGWLAQHNVENGFVQHALRRPNPDIPVQSIFDLLLDDPPDTPLTDRLLSFDREALYRKGNVERRVTVNVFDAHYYKEDLNPALLNDAEQMRLMPPPINVVASPTNTAGSFKDIGDGADATKGFSYDKENSRYSWSKYGAYVIRVQLYDVDKSGKRVLKRFVDEGFYQVLPPDLPGT